MKKIQPFVEKLTGLNNDMLLDKPVFNEIAEEINRFTKGLTCNSIMDRRRRI